MSCNCQNVYKFQTPVNGCNTNGFKQMFAGLADGTYSVELEFLNGRHLVGITKLGSDIETVGSVVLNENYTYTGRVLDASGNVVPLYFETVPYDCFQFDTEIILS